MEKVFIKSYPDEISAEIAKGKLLSQGVVAERRENKKSNDLIGAAGLQLGSTDLYVDRDDEQKAISILSLSEKHSSLPVKKINKIIISYVLAIFLCTVVFLLELSKKLPNKYSFGVSDFSIFLVVFSAFFVPLMLFTGLKPKNNKIQSFSRGFIIWIFISIIPYEIVRFVCSVFLNNNLFYIYFIIQVGIGVYLVRHYSFPKGFILPALIFPNLFNLYLLVYGEWKNQKLSVA